MTLVVQFNFAARFGTIVGFQERPLFINRRFVLSCRLLSCQLQSAFVTCAVFKFNERKPGVLQSVEAACRPCSAL